MNFPEDHNDIAVPDRVPDEPILDAELVGPRQDDDQEPNRYCPSHMPDGSHGKPCGGCRDARENRKEWNARRRNRNVADLLARAADAANRQADAAPPRPTHQCNDCHDSQIFIDASGRPGRQVRICNHDHSRRPATADELNRYAAVIERINTGTWDTLNPEQRAELIAEAQEAAA